MTQCEAVLKYMKDNGKITTMDAYECGITRLSARIWDLKKKGVKNSKATHKYKAGDGKYKRYDIYMLGEGT